MAGSEWLDDLTRSLSHGASRRGALRGAAAALVAGIVATLSPPRAPTKKGKGKGDRKRRKRKGSGFSQPTGNCSVEETSEGLTLHVEVISKIGGKLLTLDHRSVLPSPGDPSAEMRIELGQQLVLQYEIDKPDDALSRLRVRYGLGFSGVEEALFIIIHGGQTMGGAIDGRALVPRSVEDVQRDPEGWEFDDGGPAPDLVFDPIPHLRPALQSIFEQAGAEIAGCGKSQPRAAAAKASANHGLLGLFAAPDVLGGNAAFAKNKDKKNRRRGRAKKNAGRMSAEDITVCDEVSDGCLACWAGCFAGVAGCCAGTLGFGCGACYAAYEGCLDLCDAGECCPVECGNDPPSSCCCEGETCCEGNCCEKDETCWPGGVCCRDGLEFCDGKCCPQNTFCKEGICCRENAEPCFGECCPPGETCREKGLCCPPEVVDCDGECCPSPEDACQGTVCCPLGQVVCDGSCCPPENICHPKDGGSEENVCCPPDLVCGEVCCDELSRCIDPEHGTCCGFALEVCAGVCCQDSGDVCVGRSCCPGARACGETCCPPGHFCAGPGTEPGAADCRPCGEGEIPCPFSVEGAPDCCPQNTQCCGSGECCAQGVPCCDQGGGPKCDPTCIS